MNQKLVTIGNTEIPLVEYKGQRVVTFAMIDQVHGRPEGTAKRNLQENRHHLKEGEDFHLVDYAKKNEFRTFGIDIPPRGITVITETGYLMLVKSFTDDLAWEVQRQLVRCYFQVKGMPTGQGISKPLDWTAVARAHAAFRRMAKGRAKLVVDQVALADRATEKALGIDVRALYVDGDAALGVASPAPQKPVEIGYQEVETLVPPDATLCVRDAAALMGGLTSVQLNKFLYAEGYQEPQKVRGQPDWRATAKGNPFAVIKYVPKANGQGGAVPQLFWKATILEALRSKLLQKPLLDS
ncbi:MAG: ORF6N domain-containing protein [Acidithiobacillus sp.]